MDELIIEDKKYISSKRAADITGYAKDYVGQLCREGYVQARRVGRNWYVLESAIKDHRFGNPDQAQPAEEVPEATVPPTWEAPRYEPVTATPLPSINRLRPVASVNEDEPSVEPVSGDFRDAWQGWFESFGSSERLLEAALEIEEAHIEVPEEPPKTVVEEVVPLHRMRAHEMPDMPMVPVVEPLRPRFGPSFSRFALQTVLIIVALFFALTAIFGTGYFDTAPVTSEQLSRLSGMSVLEKSSRND